MPATAQAASAFARHFFAEVNRGYKTRDVDTIRRLSHPDCNSCQNIMDDIERLRSAGLQVAGERFRLDYAETAPFVAGQPVFVDFRFSSDRYAELAADGSVRLDAPPRTGVLAQARLIRSDARWLMYGLREVPE
jgi:hypothetical protein